jgi:hypothetical protein
MMLFLRLLGLPVADSDIPEKLLPAVRLAVFWVALPFIGLLLGGEDVRGGNYYWATAWFGGALLSIAVAVYWNQLITFAKSKICASWSSIRQRSHDESISISAGIYVAEMLMSLDKLQSDRYSEIIIRLFNGTGQIIAIEALGGLTGEIRFQAANGTNRTLPSPTINPSTNKLLFPFKESFIFLSQRVPPDDADEILRTIDEGKRVLLYFDKLTIEVRYEKQTTLEKLKLLDGITIMRGINYGRIVALSAGPGLSVGKG